MSSILAESEKSARQSNQYQAHVMSSGTMFILQPLSLYYTPFLVSPHPQPPPPPHHFANIQHLLYHQSSLKASGRTERRRRRKRRMKGLHSEHHSTNITATISGSISSCSSSNERTQFGETKINDECTELADEDTGDGQCDKEVLPDGESVFKRHCRVCSKTLTCSLQAQQHFNGKRHLRRLKRYIDIEACRDTSPRHSAVRRRRSLLTEFITIVNCVFAGRNLYFLI